jgi:hypothetical protein
MNMAVGGFDTLVSDFVTANGEDEAAAALLRLTDINPASLTGGNLYDDETFAEKLVASMLPELDDTDQASQAASVVDYMAVTGLSRGATAVDLIEALDSIDSTDPVFGASAARFDAAVAAADAYTGDSTDISTLQDVVGATGSDRGQNITLTALQDIVNGSSGSDTIRGVAGSAVGQQDQTTLNSSDILDGAGGNDLLAVLLTGGNYAGGATIENIETLQIGTNDAAVRAFDYNVNLGAYEVTGVETVVYDQINTGETLNVTNITPSATGGVAPVLKWDNEAGSTAGTMGATFREATVTGSTNLTIQLDDVRNGVMNIGGGVETMTIVSQGSTANRLNASGNTDGQTDQADLVSADEDGTANDGALTKVVVQGAMDFGTAAGVITSSTDANYGLTDRVAGADTGNSNTSAASNLVSVAATVTEIDASAATGNTSMRFTPRENGAAVDVTYQGGTGNDYIEFELGKVNATGGAGADTFAFITQRAGVTNSTFGSTDSIVGGEGTDAIQVGLNGIGTYTLNTTEFSNKTGIDVLDLRGANNTVTISNAFAAATDGAKLEIRTDKIVQTSATSTANPTGANAAETNSTSTINLTDLAQDQGVKVMGGSGSERVVADNASMNALVEIDLSTNGGTAGRYDTLTVIDDAVLDSGDLANVKGVEALILTESGVGNATFTVELTETFLLNNTSSSDSGSTTIDDASFRIGSATSSNANILDAGDTVTIDITDLLNSGRTALKTSLAGRGIDVVSLTNAGVAVNYVVDGAAASAAQIALVTNADANRADAGVSSAAGAVIATPVTLTAGGTFTGTAGVDDTFTGTQASLTGTTVTGTAADTETLTLTDAGTLAIPATVTNIDVLNLANGTNVITGITAAGVTTVNGGTGNDTVTANAGTMDFVGGDGNDSYISAVGGAISANINGGNGVDTLTLVNGDNLTGTVTNMDTLVITAGATISVGANSLLTQFTSINASATGANETINVTAGSHDISGSTVGAFLIEGGQTTTFAVTAGATLTVAGDAQLTAANVNFTGAGNLTTTADLTLAAADTISGTITLGAAGLTLTDRAASTTIVGTTGADIIDMQTVTATGAKTVNLGGGGADQLLMDADTTTVSTAISGWTTAAVIDLDDTTGVTASAVNVGAGAGNAIALVSAAAGAATNAYILQGAAAQINGALTETANGGAVELAILNLALDNGAGRTNTQEAYFILDNGTDTGIYRAVFANTVTALDAAAEIAVTLVGTISSVTTDALAANDFS